MKRLISLLLGLLLFCGCAAPEETTPTESITIEAPTPVTEATVPPTETTPPTESNALTIGPGNHRMTYESSTHGDYLDYYLHVPENAIQDMPLVIFLHGDGQVDKIEDLENFGMILKAREFYGENFPFLALTPCTRVISWVKDTIPDTLMELIGYVVETYHIDPEKIIVTGHSRGAIGTWNLISLYGDYFSAAVPISCDCGDRIINYDMAAQVPVWAFVGDLGELDEKYRPAMNYMCYEIGLHGGEAQLTVLRDHYHDATCLDAFTEELFLWMLEQ